MLKKIITAVLITTTLFVSSPIPALAQEWYAPTYGEFNDKVQGGEPEEIFGERYTQAQVYWIMYSLINFLVGNGFLNCTTDSLEAAGASTGEPDQQTLASELSKCTEDTQEGTSLRSQSPILALAGTADNILNVKPASGVEYLANTFNIIPEAQAQGFGYNSLSGSQNLWKASRNMAYALMILVFIVLAFGIMLRVKLSPQTVINIQSALPKIAIGLILITFSFAIAGLMIDLAYLVQGIFATFFKATTQGSGTESLTALPTVFDVMDQMNKPVEGILSIGFMVLFVALFVGIIGGLTVGWLVPVVGTFTGFIGGIILALLLLLVFIVAIVRLIWLFLRTYASLLLYIIFGPFFILMGAANLGSGVSGWIRSIAAHLSVFVVANVMIVMAHVIIWGSGAFYWLAHENNFNPFRIATGQASLGATQVPGFGTFSTETLGFFVGIVVILSIPNIANAAKEFVATGRVGRFELGVGAAFALPRQLGGMAVGQYMNFGRPADRIGALENELRQLENKAKNSNSPTDWTAVANKSKELRQEQARQEFVRNASRGKF